MKFKKCRSRSTTGSCNSSAGHLCAESTRPSRPWSPRSESVLVRGFTVPASDQEGQSAPGKFREFPCWRGSYGRGVSPARRLAGATAGSPKPIGGGRKHEHTVTKKHAVRLVEHLKRAPPRAEASRYRFARQDRGEGDRNLRRLRWRHRMDLVPQQPAAFEGSTSIAAGAGLRRSGHSSFANVTACRPPSAALTANIFNHTNRKRSSESHDAM